MVFPFIENEIIVRKLNIFWCFSCILKDALVLAIVKAPSMNCLLVPIISVRDS